MPHTHHVQGKKLFMTVVLNIIITLSQIIGGLASGSLALLSDALHNFSDVLALLIAYIANRLSTYPDTKEKTFGYKRAEILAALFNASILIGVALFLIIEAFNKLRHPANINSIWVIGLGLLSIALNTLSVLFVKGDSHDSLNIKAVYLHLLSDVVTSVAVVAGGILMYYFGLFWVDPIISLLIALYLIVSSLKLIKETTAILMQFAPKEVEIEKLVSVVESLPQIDNIHHLHIWKLDEHNINLEAHLDFNKNVTLSESNRVIDTLEELLNKKFGISHTTFQCEYNRNDKKDIIV